MQLQHHLDQPHGSPRLSQPCAGGFGGAGSPPGAAAQPAGTSRGGKRARGPGRTGPSGKGRCQRTHPWHGREAAAQLWLPVSAHPLTLQRVWAPLAASPPPSSPADRTHCPASTWPLGSLCHNLQHLLPVSLHSNRERHSQELISTPRSSLASARCAGTRHRHLCGPAMRCVTQGTSVWCQGLTAAGGFARGGERSDNELVPTGLSSCANSSRRVVCNLAGMREEIRENGEARLSSCAKC